MPDWFPDMINKVMFSGTGKKMDTRNLVYLVNACRRFTGDGLNTLQFTVEEKCKYQVGAYYQCKVNL